MAAIKARAFRRCGTAAEASAGVSAFSAACNAASTAAPPGSRFHVVSMPSMKSCCIGAPSTTISETGELPLRSAEPWPWLRCWVRLQAPSSEYETPSAGL